MEDQLTQAKLDLDANPFPDLEAMYAYWQDLRGDAFAPARAAFDPVDVAPCLLPRIMMVDVIGDPPDFVYRHWGTGITDLHGRDMTGRSVRGLAPAPFADLMWRQYVEVVETGTPGLYVHHLPGGADGRYPHAILRLPFSSDGTKADMVLSLDEYGHNKEQLRLYFRAAAPATKRYQDA